jgi:spore maturation protein CgeB
MAPSRVLVAFTSRPPIIRYLTKAFNRLGVETDFIESNDNTLFDRYVIHRINKLAHSLRLLPKSRHLFRDHPLAHINYRNRKIQEKIRSFRPDVVLVVRGLHFDPDFIQGPMKFAWWVEGEERVHEALREAHAYDWYFFISESCVGAAREQGYDQASFLHHSVDADEFRRVKDIRKDLDFCFVGNWSPKRQEYIDAAFAVTSSGAIYGAKWRRKNLAHPRLWPLLKGSYIAGEELNALYNRSRVVINITNWGNGEAQARSGMTMRILEVPATGSLLLTDSSREIERILVPGEHLVTFDGIQDFREKLARYLANDQEREAIAARGMQWVRSRYSYDQIALQVIDTYRQLHVPSLPAIAV